MVEFGTGSVRTRKVSGKGIIPEEFTTKQPTIGFNLTRDEAAKLSVYLNSAVARIEPKKYGAKPKTKEVIITLYLAQKNDVGYHTSVSVDSAPVKRKATKSKARKR